MLIADDRAEYRRKYRQEHREERAEYQRKYRAEHPEKRLEWKRTERTKYRARGHAYICAAKDKPCLDCGGRFHPAAMEFHHRDPATKEFNVGQRRGLPLWRLEAEIAKCDLICANCHRIRHHACSDVE